MPWELWRQDEHGNEFLIRAFDDPISAEKARADFVASGHHQHYWVKDLEPTDASGSETNTQAARSGRAP